MSRKELSFYGIEVLHKYITYISAKKFSKN